MFNPLNAIAQFKLLTNDSRDVKTIDDEFSTDQLSTCHFCPVTSLAFTKPYRGIKIKKKFSLTISSHKTVK